LNFKKVIIQENTNHMTTPILEMRNITKEFPGVKALNNVTFSVQPGGFIVWWEKMAQANPR